MVKLTVTDNGNKTSTDTTFIAINEQIVDLDFSGGYGLTINIHNPTEYDLLDILLSIEIDGKIQNMDYRNERINFIPNHNSYSLTLPLVGFGRGIINVALENYESSDQFFTFGPFVLI